MIIEIKVANYRSINEEQTLSFVADRATRHPNNLIKRPGYRLLKSIGLFGANASGKSNFLKAIGAMSTFVRDSATKMNDGDPIEAAEPYRLDPATREQPSRFEITFVKDGTVYTYGFAADPQRVHEEWLSAKTETSEKPLFNIKRQYRPLDETEFWDADGLYNSTYDLLIDRTRDNALLLSTAARENVKELLPIYHYMREQIEAIDVSDPPTDLIARTAMQCESDKGLQGLINSLLRDADTGIDNFQVKSFKRLPFSHIATDEEGNKKAIFRTRSNYYPTENFQDIVMLRQGSDGETIQFDFKADESNGTQRFFGLAGLLLNALEKGSFLALDELDASMHPLLTRRLLEMFQSPEANPNGAQLLFTTHDPSLLDQELFRRDQIWLTEKHNGASTFFSLADIQPPIRNTEAFLGNYLTGRYGGTPHLGPAFDLVETGSKA